MRNVDRDIDLVLFLERNGVSLSQLGSSEFGLSRNDSIVFLNMLVMFVKVPLGVEIWRRVDSRLVIDSLGGWYSGNECIEAEIQSARDFISKVDLSEGDLMTIQFN